MNREVTVRYSPELIKFAVWKFWIRTIGIAGFVGFAVVCIAFIYVLLSGDRSWRFGFLAAVAGISFGIGIVSYFIFLKQIMAKFERTNSAKIRFTDDRIGFESNMGVSELPWNMIDKIWKYPSVWLVFIAKQGYVTLPTADLDEEIKEFVLQKVNENGGKLN